MLDNACFDWFNGLSNLAPPGPFDTPAKNHHKYRGNLKKEYLQGHAYQEAFDEDSTAELVVDSCDRPVADILPIAEHYQVQVGRDTYYRYLVLVVLAEDRHRDSSCVDSAPEHPVSIFKIHIIIHPTHEMGVKCIIFLAYFSKSNHLPNNFISWVTEWRNKK